MVARGLERLERVELPPFRAASGAGVAAMMTAHVLYSALDPDQPATFSLAICHKLLRRTIGFEGVLFSDDLEMGAVHRPIEHAAVDAVWAGCDVLLICKDWALQERAHAALVERFESDEAFAARCREAAERSLGVRGLCPAQQQDEAGVRAALQSGDGPRLLEQIEARSMAMAETERRDSGDHIDSTDPPAED
jgi:beta-N-acetylhexosaminidase